MYRRHIALLLCIALVFGLFGCTHDPIDTQPPTTVPPTTAPAPTDPPGPPPEELYRTARAAIDEAENLKLYLTTQTVSTVSGDSFHITIDQDISMKNLGTDDLIVKVTEDIDINEQYARNIEYFESNAMYANVESGSFFGKVEPETYLARFAPAVLLDDTLYGSITAEAEDDGTRILFAEPSSAEGWIFPPDAQLITASGSALISAEGKLTETVYTIEYQHGAVHYLTTVTAKAEPRPSITIVDIGSSRNYLLTKDPTIPRIYQMATMYLLAAQNVSTTISESVLCEAVDCAYIDETILDMSWTDEDPCASLEYTFSTQQYGAFREQNGSDLYLDGTFSRNFSDEEPEIKSYPSDYMLPYFEEYLTANLLPLDDATSLMAVPLGDILYLEVTCTDDVGMSANNYANSKLFGNAGYLNSLSSHYETLNYLAYLAIDLHTGFPTGAGIFYTGLHTINGQDCFLAMTTVQSFHLANPDAREAVTGEPEPEIVPEEPATPLFYHVTGPEGQEMWMLGTIHVGDERTAYLPQEIYDAFDASDALAVEFDMLAFEEAVASDPAMAETVSSLYYYPDGSLTAEHLDELTYQYGIALLRAGGEYRGELEFSKPFLWGQLIDDLYLRQSYSLSSQKGVDMRLLNLAKESGKEILDVESGLDQLRMLSGYSDDIQAYILAGSIANTPTNYRAQMLALYSAWCSGDEEAIKALLFAQQDLSGLTDEERAMYEATLPLYEEYYNALSIDRNDGMLEKAVEYLESGETVFFAVGLAHLLDDTNGLVTALQEAGYTVELVTYA